MAFGIALQQTQKIGNDRFRLPIGSVVDIPFHHSVSTNKRSFGIASRVSFGRSPNSTQMSLGRSIHSTCSCSY
jgi:hypothetical protein